LVIVKIIQMKQVKILVASVVFAAVFLIGSSFITMNESSPISESVAPAWKLRSCPAGMGGYICSYTTSTLPLCPVNFPPPGPKDAWNYWNCKEK